jgi:hypothetical protein
MEIALLMPMEMAFVMNSKSAVARTRQPATTALLRQKTTDHVIFARA